MKVALVCPYAWDDPGGVQVHVRELGDRLRLRGHEVIVLTPARGRPAEAWVVGVGKPIDVTYNSSNAPISPRPGTWARVREAIRAFDPDVIHVHEPLTPSVSMFATLSGSAPIVATFHSGAERSRLFDVAAPLLRRVARRIGIRVAVSERAASFARERIGGEFRVVPNGVDVERWENSAPADLGSGTKLLFVGRLDERKGFPTAVESFGRLAAERADLRLIAAGDGPDRDAIGSLPADLRDRVVMLGAVANRELPPIHAACDVYLGTSIGGESFGYVLVEAMAAGLPVVASDIPGYDEVIHDGVEGLLVPPRAPGALAAAVGRVLDDGDLAARLVAGGRERARRFDWSRVVVELDSIYSEALERGAAPLR